VTDGIDGNIGVGDGFLGNRFIVMGVRESFQRDGIELADDSRTFMLVFGKLSILFPVDEIRILSDS
jgi:hypothetical protein